MPKYFSTLLAILLFASCKKTDTINGSGILGNWKLIEVLADPGDLSGKFMKVQSNKKIIFTSDSSFTCTGNICDMSIEANVSSRGVFRQLDKKVIPENCSNVNLIYTLDGNTLLISYPCIEPCISKYVRVK